jgi:hypothetical protein
MLKKANKLAYLSLASEKEEKKFFYKTGSRLVFPRKFPVASNT